MAQHQIPPDQREPLDCSIVDASGQVIAARSRNNLRTLRAFRDDVLANSGHGTKLIKEYSKLTPRVLLLFIRQPRLRKDAARAVEAVTPIARAMLRGPSKKDSALKITAKTVDLVTRFAEALADADRGYKDGGFLAKAIRARLVEINPKALIGLSAREARRALRL